LTIYLSPETFIAATNFMDKCEDYSSEIIKIIANENKDQPDWLGKAIETTYINIIYGQRLIFRLGRDTFHLWSKDTTPKYSFVQFLRMITE
jgi:hypothetical protein